MKETLYKYYEITEENVDRTIDSLDSKFYQFYNGRNEHNCWSGGNIKFYRPFITQILLPFSPPKDVSDEELLKIGKEILNNKFGREFIIQKMNELVNDILCKPAENHVRLKKYPSSNYICDFINDWADKNLIEGKESDAKNSKTPTI